MQTLPDFRATNCTRYRYRYSECRRCADACPYAAVALSDEGISIDASACRNCTLCVAACPTEALTARDLARIDILKRATKQPAVTFVCAPSGLKGDEIVPCQGALDAAMLAHLASRGVAVTLAGNQHCAACPHGAHGERQLDLHLEAVAALKSVAGDAGWADITVSMECDAPCGKPEHKAARRHLFRRLVGRGVDQMTRPLAPVEAELAPLKAIRFTRQFSTAGREVLQLLFDNAKSENASSLPAHPAIFAARIEAPSGCTACEACARACPTDALHVKESGCAWELTFDFSRCVGCGVCTEACQPRVLHMAHAIHDLKSAQPVALHTRSKQRCNRCDRFFISPAAAEVCPVCASDDEDFAALFGQ